MKKILALFLIFFIPIYRISAQEHQHHKSEKMENSDTTNYMDMKMNMGTHDNMHMDKNITRHGSGTAWLPDNSPMYGYLIESEKWMFMIHGNLFIRYNYQDITKESNRGDKKFDAPIWFMGMARREISSSGLIRLTSMLSLDPITVGGEGYPLLFQSGETWKGKPLVDRQHPHDLISELSLEYIHSFNDDVKIIGYFGYPGEPALGPVAFMHRTSALNNPDAPLGHHWQDATHITFGVATLGFQIKNYKLEGSLFTGREPNENRYNFDKPKFDSYSLRISANPNDELALQVSHAFTISPESIDPNQNIRKTTASVIHSKIFNDENILSTSLIWGFNDVLNEHQENSILLESNFKLNMSNIYGRLEWIEKSSDELEIEELPHGNVYPIYALTLGINHSFFTVSSTNLILGIQGSLFKPHDALILYYGNNPFSAEVYMRIAPDMMMH